MGQRVKIPPAAILTVSCDQGLQEQRRILLQNAGYHVVSMRDDTKALVAVCSSRPFDLMLICPSVPDESRAGIAQALTACSNLPILMLYSVFDGARVLVKGSMPSTDDPEVFLKTIRVLIAPARRALRKETDVLDPFSERFPPIAKAAAGASHELSAKPYKD